VCRLTPRAEVWRRLCQNTYKQFWAEYEDGRHQEPDSWKEKFFVRKSPYRNHEPHLHYSQDLRIQEAKKFEMLGAKLRNKRVEHEERKKEKEVKYTDKVPPAKKQRTCTTFTFLVAIQ
jgi:elongin-A